MTLREARLLINAETDMLLRKRASTPPRCINSKLQLHPIPNRILGHTLIDPLPSSGYPFLTLCPPPPTCFLHCVVCAESHPRNALRLECPESGLMIVALRFQSARFLPAAGSACATASVFRVGDRDGKTEPGPEMLKKDVPPALGPGSTVGVATPLGALILCSGVMRASIEGSQFPSRAVERSC